MSSAAVATAFGGPEVLALIEVNDQTPDTGEVVVQIRAAAVNPIDYKLYSGAFGTDEASLPMRLGLEAAGVVTEVGDGATGPAGQISVGDEVVVYPVTGAYAERIVATADSVLPKPATMSFAQAAGLLLTGTTAAHCVVATDVRDGDTVLVHAAAGGVGLIVVQLANRRGARVIGTASDGEHDTLRGLGVEPLTYGPGLIDRVRALAPNGVDVAIDCIGSDEAMDASIDLVTDRQRIATIANFSRSGDGIQVLGNGPGADAGEDIRTAARQDLLRWATDGSLTVSVAQEFPLSAVRDAHLLSREGHTHGKIVLLP